jgi:beta-phosphoglucomutase
MVKGVLFDLDGVIVDTLHYHYLAWKKMFEERGGTVSEQTILLHEGRNSREILPILMKEAGINVPPEEQHEFIEKKRRYYRSITRVSFYPKALAVVEKTRDMGVRCALVTACTRKNMEAALNRHHQALFEIILTGDDVPRAKPHPDPYQTAQVRLGLRPDECVVIENAPLGVQSAKAAGIPCVAVATTLGKEHLSDADYIVDKIEEIFDLPMFRDSAK